MGRLAKHGAAERLSCAVGRVLTPVEIIPPGKAAAEYGCASHELLRGKVGGRLSVHDRDFLLLGRCQRVRTLVAQLLVNLGFCALDSGT